MRNVIPLPNSRDCSRYIREQLLQTEMLRDSYDEGGLIAQLIQRFTRRPRFFYEPSEEYVEVVDSEGVVHREFVEAPHFSPWWGGIQLRTYDNALVQDLYYLHEICHAATMPYGPDLVHICTDPVTFKNKIRDNEHEASTLSEMTIYCEFPQLRAMSFQHEIFVDRFLFPSQDKSQVNATLIQRWRDEPEIVEKELMYARAAVLTAPNVDESDLAAFWLKRFYSQGKAWTNIWTNPKGEYVDIPLGGRFREVERAMVRFREDCVTQGRSVALQRHLNWLQSLSITTGTEIPFYPEARAFCESYLRHKILYFRSLQRHGTTTEVHRKESR
ncbi:hypothetical protein VN12_05225 [Pirellula sp. SH-Sr6A]|uniref:hypothetical protein n=1 Tax=Pirellula sp. SH-Sr6A TaxID=1632865 RepID=UPI00078EBB1C|nr:hypothetical protein [Pirellula sp. SH-Sr6A]AMV31498.1 hypothetical protein VN12_05225 [Pirellula sp. SH-Sr6A]